MAVIACSSFHNETDILEIRLRTLSPVVDRFVLTEATVTHRNVPRKPVLHDLFDTERFAQWRDQVTVVVVDDMPDGPGWMWDFYRERHQRNAILRGLDGLEPDDRVLVSDGDEIPTAGALALACADPPMRFTMHYHTLRLNWRLADPPGADVWAHSMASVHSGAEILAANVPDADIYGGERYGAINYVCLVPPFRILPIGGWHLTYQGSRDRIRAHMLGNPDGWWETYVPAHVKATRQPESFVTDEWLDGCIRDGRDLYGRAYRYEWVDTDQLPPCVAEQPSRWRHLLVDQPVPPGRLSFPASGRPSSEGRFPPPGQMWGEAHTWGGPRR